MDNRDTEIFRQLEKEDWGAIGKRLLAFAEWWAGNYQWRRGGESDLAQGKTLVDVIQEVILKTFSRERKWDPEKGELVPWLRDQVKSVIDALAKSAAHRYEVSFPEEDGEGLDERVLPSLSADSSLAAVSASSPEQIVLEKEAAEQAEQKVSALFEKHSGEPDLEEMLESIMNGCEPRPRYLAADLGVSVEDVNNRLKRLRRRAQKGKTK